MNSHITAHIAATDLTDLVHHCDHPDGAATYRVGDMSGSLTVYVFGTPADLRAAALAMTTLADFADRQEPPS